jgi:hypothetical protein|tara:strand:- start:1350 stop:1967 length:618 start_codon:yes stop_codon:yes gene_type:complete
MAILTQSSNGDGPITGWSLEPCRPGQYLAICLEVKDSFGIQRPKYEDPSQIETLDVCRFLFGTQDGQLVQTGEMKISAHEKSKLTGVLTSWLGSAPGAGFDTETLRGKGAMINIVEKTSQKGRTYSDITSVTPVMAGMEAQVPQASNFTIPGGSPAPAPAQPVQPAPAQPAPQATTTVTVEQPQTVQPAQTQMFSQPSSGQSVPF